MSNNLTGEWSGKFYYPNNEGSLNPFLARIQDHNGNLSGDITEPNLVGQIGDYLYAKISGSCEGREVTFLKTYDGQGDFAHVVHYNGALNESLEIITGFWHIDDYSGSFKMRRNTDAEEEQEERETAKVV